MTPSARLLEQPETFRRLTGLTPVAFDRLLTDVTAAWEAAQALRGRRQGRKRRIGESPPFALALADRLLMLRIRYRTYVPHAFLGFLFGIDDGTVCRSNRRVEPLLAGVFRIPERKVELSQTRSGSCFSTPPSGRRTAKVRTPDLVVADVPMALKRLKIPRHFLQQVGR